MRRSRYKPMPSSLAGTEFEGICFVILFPVQVEAGSPVSGTHIVVLGAEWSTECQEPSVRSQLVAPFQAGHAVSVQRSRWGSGSFFQSSRIGSSSGQAVEDKAGASVTPNSAHKALHVIWSISTVTSP